MKIPYEYFVTPITTALSVSLTYFFTARHFTKNIEHEVSRERYDNFYVPYIRILYKLSSDMTYDYYGPELMNLFFSNLKYVDARTSKLFYNFSDMYREALEFVNYDKYFPDITKSVLAEARTLSHVLKLPDIAEPFSAWIQD
jgi:hypothetical protein|nr:MAG TPA: hypothetical protein [Caudoviricetes sp.]